MLGHRTARWGIYFQVFFQTCLYCEAGSDPKCSEVLLRVTQPSAQITEPRRTTGIVPKSGSWYRTSLLALNQPNNIRELTSHATHFVSGGTLLVGDIHYRSDRPDKRQPMHELLQALSQMQGLRRIVVGGDIIDSASFRDSHDIPEQIAIKIAGKIVEVLEQIHKISGVPKKEIVIGLGNHDAPTTKVKFADRDGEERVIPQQIGHLYLKRLLTAGYTVGATSPELIFRAVGGVAVSHVPSQAGPNFTEGLSYRRSDRNGQVYTPNLPKRPIVLPSDIYLQVNFDTHNASITSGPHRRKTGRDARGSFTTVSVPNIGGTVSESEGNFRGVVVIGKNGIPYGWRLDFASDEGPAKFVPNPMPVRISDSIPLGLDSAPEQDVHEPVTP